MKHNRTLSCSILLAAFLVAASCSSQRVNLTCNLAPVKARFDIRATIDSVLILGLTPDGEYQTVGHATINGNTATFTSEIDEPVFGKIKYILTVPGGTGSSESNFILEPGDIISNDAFTFHGSKGNDAVNDALEKLAQCIEDPQAVRALVDDFQRKHDDVATASFFTKALPQLGMERWASLLKTTSDGVKNNPHISQMSKSVEKNLEAQRVQALMAPGAQYADFRGLWEGKEYRLSDFVNQGKYVLVDFWAS